MIALQRSADRLYVRNGALEMWKTFDPADSASPLRRQGFRALVSLNEVKVPPRTEFKILLEKNREVLTYVREEGLLIRGGPQSGRFLGPGSYRRAGEHSWISAHVPAAPPLRKAQVFLSSRRSPSQASKPRDDYRQCTFADRYGKLLLAASSTGEANSLSLQQDVRLYTSVLDRGHHLAHELDRGRGAWLQVVAGRIRLIDRILESGDGVSLEGEAAVSFTAQVRSEILLFDLA